MNLVEKKDAIRLAPAIRASRKLRGKSQSWIAKELGISQSAICRVEKGEQLLSAPSWFHFCDVLDLDPDLVYRNGYIDNGILPEQRDVYRDRCFKVPKRYAKHSGSTARILRAHLACFEQITGKPIKDYLEYRGIDPDFFYVLDNQINLEFALDIARTLNDKGLLNLKTIKEICRYSAKPLVHGKIWSEYATAPNSKELVKRRLLNIKKYERNFDYRIKEERKNTIFLSITPRPVVRFFDYRNEVTGTYLTEYKKELLIQFARDIGGVEVKVEILESHFKGAKSCLYKITVPERNYE